MEFQLPHALLALAVVPLAVGWYVRQQQRRLADAARFAQAVTRPSVADPPSRWRHLPPLLFLLSAVVLILGAARPVQAVYTPQEAVRLVLALDVSGSMARDDVSPTRLGAAIAVAERFARDLPAEAEVGVVAFNHRASLEVPPTTDREHVVAGLKRLVPNGGTAIGEGIRVSLAALTPPPPAAVDRPLSASEEAGAAPPDPTPEPQGAIVLLSDGDNTFGSDPRDMAARAAALGVPIYTIGLGDPARATFLDVVNEELLMEVSALTGGTYLLARNLDELRGVYDELGHTVVLVEERREQAWLFALAGLVVALLGSAASLVRANRLC